MIDNETELHNFKESLTAFKQLSNGDIVFAATIEYEYSNKKEVEVLNTTIHLTTWEYGKITIEEGDVINSNNVYMEFNIRYQIFKCINNSLQISTLNSPKIGKYKNIINPLQ